MRILAATFSMLFLFAMNSAQGQIFLDFETPATGSDLFSTPLVTSEGTITLSNATSVTDLVFHDEGPNPGFAVFDFDFDASSITFDYNGNGDGDFTGEVLDAAGNVIDSFFDPDTGDIVDFDSVTLAGTGIRSFRFADAPAGGFLSSVDNLAISTAVPEPSSMILLAGIVAIGATLRRSKS